MSAPTEPAGRQPLPPAKRRRLQQFFEHGSRSSAKGDFDYATQMFTECVLGDPGNIVYLQNFLGNLYKYYNNNKKGHKLAAIKGMASKGATKKASLQKDWHGVLTSGVEMLKLNPWDTSTLAAMAHACRELEYDECEIAYLKAALEADMKDPEVNRLLGRAMARQGRFDEAIVYWRRVAQARPDDEEARKAVADLDIERTITKGGYEEAQSSTEVMADKQLFATSRLTPEQQLEKQIAKDQANVSLYLQLADLHVGHEQFAEAEEVLTRALNVSGGDVNVRERLEDTRLRRQRAQVEIAKKRATEEKTSEAVELYKKLLAELNNMELEVYRNRCERYPGNLGLKYQLGVRLQRAKMYTEAIKAFQDARNEPQQRGSVLLALGECFQQIEQYKLAMSNYEQALEEISDRDEEQKKLALYRAGKLALGLKDLDKAEKYLTELAARDFGYKEVAESLDKIRRLREDSPSP